MTRTITGRRLGSLVMVLLCVLSLVALAPAQSSAQEAHVVKWGDTLSEIADRYGLTVDQLISLNGISDPDLIISGQFLSLTNGSGEVLQGGPQPVSEDVAEAPVLSSYGDSSETWALVNSGDLPPAFERDQIRDLLIDAAHRYGWDPYLIMAQAWQESYWSQNEISWTGAIGVMQVMPDTADYVNGALDHGSLDVRETEGNVHLGVAYLRHMQQTMGSTKRALAAYYSGPGNVKGRLKGYQRAYVRSVLALRERFR